MIIVTTKMIMKMIMKKMIMIIVMTMMIYPPGDTPPSLEAGRLHKRPHSPLEWKTCQDCHQRHDCHKRHRRHRRHFEKRFIIMIPPTYSHFLPQLPTRILHNGCFSSWKRTQALHHPVVKVSMNNFILLIILIFEIIHTIWDRSDLTIVIEWEIVNCFIIRVFWVITTITMIWPAGSSWHKN